MKGDKRKIVNGQIFEKAANLWPSHQEGLIFIRDMKNMFVIPTIGISLVCCWVLYLKFEYEQPLDQNPSLFIS